MTYDEVKILEKVEEEIKEKVDFCFSQMAFCRRHKFEIEAAALEYRGEAYHQCRLKVMNAIDELKTMKGGENEND